jgi:hypothetical protein
MGGNSLAARFEWAISGRGLGAKFSEDLHIAYEFSTERWTKKEKNT